MASRTVSVLLTAQVSNYISNLEAARKKTEETAKSAEKTAEGLQKQHQAFQTVGTGMAVVGAAAAVAVAAVVKTTAEFNAKMAQLKTVSHASKTEMDSLRAAALSAGTAFGYTASQVADAQIELAKAGINAKQQLGGALTGALALAAAGQIEVGKATEIAVTAMTDFKLKASDLPHVADLLAAGADKSTASVESIGQALQQSGLVAAQFGLSVEDTVGTLTAFAQAGLQGSDAGTSLKTMLLSLAKPTEQSSKALSEYNIHAYDAQGAFVGVTSLASQLQSGLGKLSAEQRNAALATIFGTDAIRSAGVLYDLGGKKLKGFIDANNEAGFASAQAAGKLDSLTGDIQKFNAVVQTDMIKAGSGLEGALRGVVQEASGMVTAFGNLPGPIQSTAVVATGLVAGVGLLGGAFLLAVPKIAEFKLALSSLGVTGKGALGAFGKGSAALVGLTAVASAFANVGTSGIASAEQIKVAGNLYGQGFKNLNDAFKGDGGFILSGGASHALDAIAGSFLGVSQSGAAKALDGLTFGITHFSDVYKSSEGQFAAIGEQLKGLAAQDYSGATNSFNTLVEKLGGGTEAAKKALSVMPAYKDALVDMLTASGQAASEQNVLAAATGSGGVASKLREAQSAAADNQEALQAMTGGASDAAGAIDELAKQIAGFGSVALDARSAQRAFEAAVDDAAAAAKKNGRNLDIASEAGRANQAALDGIASSAVAAASAILKTSGNTDEAAGAIRRGRKAFIDAAVSMGTSRAAANRLADSLNLIPKNVKTTVGINGTGAALSAISSVEARLAALNGRTARVAVIYTQTGRDIATGGARFAAGGAVNGPGPRGIDSVPALLAPGEHVLTTKDVSALGGQAGVYALRAGLQGYAKGGAIGDSKAEAEKAAKQAAQYRKQLAAAKATEKRLDKVYDGISGKKADAGRKKAAKAAADAASKRVTDLEKKLGDATDRADKAKKNTEDLRNAREDFVSAERRGGSEPLGYVDQLRSMSRDDKYTPKQQAAFKKAANDYEKTITDLNKKSEAQAKAIEASTKTLDTNKQALDDANQQLDSLKSTASQFASSISGAISGKYGTSSAVTAATADSQVDSGWYMRDGIMYRSTSTVQGDPGGATTVGSLSDYYSKSANDTGVFAGLLQQLANRNIDRALLAEIAGYGPDQGSAIARALLSASDEQFRSINNNYAATLVNSDRAGALVSDYTYGSAIAGAQGAASAAAATYNAQQAVVNAQQAAADKITATISSDGDKLRSIIGKAFGLSGYASGTDNATAGFHLVGEQGPELIRFGGGESVMNAGRTRNWIRGNRYATGSSPVNGNTGGAVSFHFTDDGSRLGVAMREIAESAISRDQMESALLEWGGAA